MTALAQILSLTPGSREGWGSLCQQGRHVAILQSPCRDFFSQALYLVIQCLQVGLLRWMNCFLNLLEPKKIILTMTAQLHNRTPESALKQCKLLFWVQFWTIPWLFFGALHLALPSQPIPWQMCCNGASSEQGRCKPPAAPWPWELSEARCWPIPFCRADTRRPPGWAAPLSHGQIQVRRSKYKANLGGGISSGYSPSFQNMQLKTSYARGSGFKFNSPWWISLPLTHPVTSLADVTSQHPHPVVRSSAVWPRHVKSHLLLFPFLQLPASPSALCCCCCDQSFLVCLLHALPNFTDVCCITLSALSVLRQESLFLWSHLLYPSKLSLSPLSISDVGESAQDTEDMAHCSCYSEIMRILFYYVPSF